MRRVAWGLFLLQLLLAGWVCEGAASFGRGSEHRTEGSRGVIVVANTLPFHVEVCIGIVATVISLQHDVIVYGYASRNAQGQRVKASIKLLQKTFGHVRFHDWKVLGSPKHAVPTNVKAIIFVSGLEEIKFNRRFFNVAIQKLQPAHVLAILHNSRSRTLTRGIVSSHPSVALLALAERNYHRLTEMLHPVPSNVHLGWMLPTLGISQGEACMQPEAPCRTHFTVQGNLASSRRDYLGLMHEMAGVFPRLQAAGIRLKLVGAGKTAPEVPDVLRGMVEVHSNLGFTEFYSEVQHSVALVPALATLQYLNGTKITSTLVTSLILGVPVLADRKFIDAYSFLPNSCFYIQQDGESTAAAMLRVAAMSTVEHQLVRRSLAQAREQLQARNLQVLKYQLELPHVVARTASGGQVAATAAALPTAMPATPRTTSASVQGVAAATAAAGAADRGAAGAAAAAIAGGPALHAASQVPIVPAGTAGTAGTTSLEAVVAAAAAAAAADHFAGAGAAVPAAAAAMPGAAAVAATGAAAASEWRAAGRAATVAAPAAATVPATAAAAAAAVPATATVVATTASGTLIMVGAANSWDPSPQIPGVASATTDPATTAAASLAVSKS